MAAEPTLVSVRSATLTAMKPGNPCKKLVGGRCRAERAEPKVCVSFRGLRASCKSGTQPIYGLRRGIEFALDEKLRKDLLTSRLKRLNFSNHEGASAP